ncbi:MAG: phage scaffolding protein [Eggerthellaceae bacterium]
MADPQPTPQQEPQPSPAPQDPAPTPDPVPTPPQQEPQPQGGAKGEPDGFQKLQREFGEVKEFINGLKKAQEPAAPTEPDLDELNAKHAAEAKSWAIERELLKSGCIDTDALMVHIKAEDVKLAEDGKSIAEGVDIEELKKSYPYLFPSSTPTEPKKTVSTSAGSGGSKQNIIPESLKEGVEAAFAAN